MILDLHVEDVVDDHKTKTDAMRLRLKRLENMQFIPRLGIIMQLDQLFTLVAIMITFVFALKYFT